MATGSRKKPRLSLHLVKWIANFVSFDRWGEPRAIAYAEEEEEDPIESIHRRTPFNTFVTDDKLWICWSSEYV